MPTKREGSTFWQIKVRGVRQSSGTLIKADAKALEDKLNADAWAEDRMGIKPAKSWQDAVIRRGKEAQGKKTWGEEKAKLKWWDQFLGKITNLNNITRELIDDIIEKEFEVDPKGACSANATANKYINVVSCILNAAEREWSWGNHAPILRLYTVNPPKNIVPTPAQVLKHVAELGKNAPHSADITLYAVSTMHRRGNITGLCWPMINWEEESVRLAGVLTKTGRAIYVPLNKTAMAILRRRYAAPMRHLTHVFHYERWSRKTRKYESHPLVAVTTAAWHKAALRSGLPEGSTLHTMRHAANSWLAEAGVPKAVRAELGGWAVGVGVEFVEPKESGRQGAIAGYTHYRMEHLRKAACLLDPMLSIEASNEQARIIAIR